MLLIKCPFEIVMNFLLGLIEKEEIMYTKSKHLISLYQEYLLISNLLRGVENPMMIGLF